MLEQLTQVDGHQINRGAVLLNLGVFKQVLNQVLHLLGLVVGDVGVLDDVFFGLVLVVFNQAQVADDRGQRGPQVVGNVGDQLVLGLFRRPFLLHGLGNRVNQRVN